MLLALGVVLLPEVSNAHSVLGTNQMLLALGVVLLPEVSI